MEEIALHEDPKGRRFIVSAGCLWPHVGEESNACFIRDARLVASEGDRAVLSGYVHSEPATSEKLGEVGYSDANLVATYTGLDDGWLFEDNLRARNVHTIDYLGVPEGEEGLDTPSQGEHA